MTATDSMDELKKCSRCPAILPKGDFPIANGHGRLFVRSWCPECLRKYYKKYRGRKKR